MLTRYRAHVVVPRVIEAEMAVLKGIIGAVVVSIEGRKSLYKEQRRVLKRLATRPRGSEPEHARLRFTPTTSPRQRRMPRAGASSSTKSRA